MLCVTGAKGLGHIWPQSGRMGGLIVAFSILRRVKLANPLGLVWVSPLTPFFLLNIIIHSSPMCLRRNGYAEATYISKHNTFTLFNTIPSETSWALAFPISRFLERTKKGLWSNRPIFSNKAIYHVTSPKPTWQAENVFPLRVSCQHPPWFIKHFPGPAAANNIGDYYKLLYYLT